MDALRDRRKRDAEQERVEMVRVRLKPCCATSVVLELMNEKDGSISSFLLR